VSTGPATTLRRATPVRLMGRLRSVCVWGLACGVPCSLGANADLTRLTIPELLDQLDHAGVTVLYSSDLVKPWMRVREAPTTDEPQGLLTEVLAPYGLTVTDGPADTLMIVRAATSAVPPAQMTAGESHGKASKALRVPQRPAALPIEEVTVHSSRYRLVRDPLATAGTLTADDLDVLPDVGDDALRAVARLPGTSASDFTAKVNVRGGEADETLVRFDGLRLYEPFHLKDFQSLVSAIDPRVVRDIDVYTGGFPAAFGDRMSSVFDVATIAPGDSAHREISLSFFNTSLLAADRFDSDAGDWLVAARRGNLDLVIDLLDSDIGRPRYTELYGHVRHTVTPSLDVAANLLRIDDDIVLFDSDREEQARANYGDRYYWLRFDHHPTQALTGMYILARADLDSARRGTSELPGVSRGRLSDWRRSTIDTLQADWTWQWRDSVFLRWGGEWRHMHGAYAYSDAVEFDVLFDAPGSSLEPVRARDLHTRPEGDQFGAYASVRTAPLPGVFLEGGLRWDRDTLSGTSEDELSPRLSASVDLGARTTVRVSWGHFFQAQSVNELQISDGLTTFFKPQRSDHIVAGLEHRLANGVELRLEAYRKDYRRLRPRFENLLDTVILLPELKPDRVRIAPDRATAKGVEVSVRRQSDGALDWWLSYTRSSVTDHEYGRDTPRAWDQRHQVNAGLTWRTERWDLSVAGRYHSGWPTTDAGLVATEPIPVAATGPRNARRLGNFYSVDARVARHVEFDSAGTLTVFLELANVFNRENDCCVEYDIEGEGDDAVLDVGTLASIPILPSLGFVWQF
jgi:TonB dependent receptor-like, beta-barrel/TonB-dependent Receptor Plug Domain